MKLVIEGPWYGCACGKRATTFYRSGQWCDGCYPGWEAVKHRPPSDDFRCSFVFPTGDRCMGMNDETHEHWLSNRAS